MRDSSCEIGKCGAELAFSSAVSQHPAWHAAVSRGKKFRLPGLSSAFEPGDACGNYFVVQEGVLRVQQISQEGRQILLYRVRPGQICIHSVACLLTRAPYAAQGIVEEDATLVAIPRNDFLAMLDVIPELQGYLLMQFGQKLNQMMSEHLRVSFANLQWRLAHHLLEMCVGDDVVKGTHEHIAQELGSSRVVISRILKEFERKGLITIGRGVVHVERNEVQHYLDDHPL